MPRETHGPLTDRITQLWVKITGRKTHLNEYPWLAGITGKPAGIGAGFFDQFAHEQGLMVKPGVGLVEKIQSLAGEECLPETLHPSVIEFYERTADYEMEAWSEWSGLFKPFGRALARLFSHRLQQLNVPLSGLDTSAGITSQVFNLADPKSGNVRHTAWMRQLVGSRNVLYAATYSVCTVPDFSGGCVKVVFPLPNGNAIVIMYPKSLSDGSLLLASSGRGFGSPGFYFTVHGKNGVWVKYLASMKETIHVYPAGKGEVRGDHTLKLWGIVFLRIHYRLRHMNQKTGTTEGPSSYCSPKEQHV